jgi:hypothetical protein
MEGGSTRCAVGLGMGNVADWIKSIPNRPCVRWPVAIARRSMRNQDLRRCSEAPASSRYGQTIKVRQCWAPDNKGVERDGEE